VRRRSLLAVAALAAAAAALSVPSSKVAWTVETVRLVRGGDPAHGKQLHKDCSDCHGPTGITDTPDVPSLAGQDVFYTFKQLQDYKDSSRQSPIMGEAVKPLSERDMADLAAFYAAQAPAPAPSSPARPDAAVVRLATMGDGARIIPACEACHGGRGAGSPPSYGMPDLRNQKFDDLSLQLTTFRSGERANDVYRVMRDVCKGLTDAEIAGLATYYSGTTGKAPAAPAPASTPAN
jgi:cytochrome c553